jgi:hypothetical protein
MVQENNGLHTFTMLAELSFLSKCLLETDNLFVACAASAIVDAPDIFVVTCEMVSKDGSPTRPLPLEVGALCVIPVLTKRNYITPVPVVFLCRNLDSVI